MTTATVSLNIAKAYKGNQYVSEWKDYILGKRLNFGFELSILLVVYYLTIL